MSDTEVEPTEAELLAEMVQLTASIRRYVAWAFWLVFGTAGFALLVELFIALIVVMQARQP